MNTTDVSPCKFGNTSISGNFLDIPEFPRLLGKFPKYQVDSQIPKILGKFPSSGSADGMMPTVTTISFALLLDCLKNH